MTEIKKTSREGKLLYKRMRRLELIADTGLEDTLVTDTKFGKATELTTKLYTKG